MKKLFIYLLIVFPSFLSAQEFSNKDPKAVDLLDKTIKKLDTKKGISADFTLTVENTRDEKKNKKQGKIGLKGEKFKLSIQGVDTYFDGKMQSVYMKDANEVTVSNPGTDELKDINPLMLIQSYKQGYKIKYIEAKQINGKTIEIIDLYPEDLKNDNSRITISIEKETLLPYSIRLQGKDGVNVDLTIDRYDFTEIIDNFFIFDASKIKNIEVVDLR